MESCHVYFFFIFFDSLFGDSSVFVSLILIADCIVWVSQNLFIHLNIDEHLGYFQFLAIASKGARTFYTSCLFLWVHIFISLPDCFPKWLCHFTVVPASSTSSPTLGMVRLLNLAIIAIIGAVETKILHLDVAFLPQIRQMLAKTCFCTCLVLLVLYLVILLHSKLWQETNEVGMSFN